MGLAAHLILLTISILHIAGLAGRATNTFSDNGQPWDRDDERYASRDEQYEQLNLEAQRLIAQYPENQQLISSIGLKPYDIIFPVQVRHNSKMGISTRDTSQKNSGRNYDGYGPVNRRMKQSKYHFASTSLYIKILNHHFELLLELNTQLLAPNLIQKHFLPNGAEQTTKQEIEHCYYQGEVRGIPGAVGAFRTCSGLSGVVHLGNETFVVHPLFGGDQSTNHPHVIFAAQKGGGKHGCANGVEVDYTNRGRARRQRHVAGGAGGVRPTFGTLLDDMVLPADVNRDLLKSFVEVDRGDDDADDDEDDDDDDLDEEADVVDGKAPSRVAEDADAAAAEVEVRRKSRAAEPSPPAAPGREGERGKGGRGKTRKAGKDAGKDAKDAGKKRRRKRKRLKRNIQGMTKFIELALVLDKAMVSKFSRRPNYTREDIVHDALQIANIADLYFRTLNTRVSVVYVETWKEGNQATVDPKDIGQTLRNFHEYTSRTLFGIGKDTTQLLSGEDFPSGQMGMAVPHTLCSVKSVGIAVEMNVYEPHLLGGIVAHMIGHNIGMLHDDGREECYCKDWHGCIMAQSIIGLNNVLPYKFSECSAKEYMDVLRLGEAMCLLNKPNEIPATGATCGNKILETGEDCDCGTVDECEADKCCDAITCKFAEYAECAHGPCCTNQCKLKTTMDTCREATNECDLPEYCTGESGFCPTNVYKKNGSPCGDTTKNQVSFCFNGTCPHRDYQCSLSWGAESVDADKECYEHFNVKGSENGHCGYSKDGIAKPCDRGNVMCGSLHCQKGDKNPVNNSEHSNIITTIGGRNTHCKTIHDVIGLVQDGTPCGENHICLNQSCTSIYPHMDKGTCPTNHANQECSAHGVCTNANRCFCEPGYAGPDCSILVDVPPTTEETISTTKLDLSSKMTQKETPYGADKASKQVSTLSMVITLVSMVFGVFLCFASVAVYCYRRGPRPRDAMQYGPQAGQGPRPHQPVARYRSREGMNHRATPEQAAVDMVDKMSMLPPGLAGSLGTLSHADSRSALTRTSNHLPPNAQAASRKQQEMHQMQSLKNRMAQAVSDDEQTHSVPEKGILKKTYGSVVPMDGGEDSTSDNQEVLSQSDNLLSSEQVEHKIRSLDGYTRSMLEALHTARNMQHQGHSSSGGNNTPSGTGSSLLTEEILRRSLESSGYPAYPSKRTSSQEKICDEGLGMMPSMVEVPYPHANYQYSYGGHGGLGTHSGTHSHDEDDDGPPPGSRPMTIRNLTDIIRQIDTVGRHISPSGSDDIQERMYHEGSESSRRGSRGREDMSFVLGRFRPSANRHGSGGSAGSSHYGHPYPGHAMHHQLPDEESIYETADPDRAGAQICGDTPDSESDDCVQARRAMAARSPSADRAGGASDKKVFVAEAAIVAAATTAVTKSPGAGGGKREYYPSPPSSSSDTADSISPSERTQLVQRSPGATSAAVAVSSTTPPHKLHNGVNGVNGSGLDGSAVGVGVGSASSSTESEDGAWAASSDSRPHGAPSTSSSPGPGLGQSQKKRYPEYKH